VHTVAPLPDREPLEHMITIDTIAIDVSSPDIETARLLMREYAALPHVAGRWDVIDADIAALPKPFVAPDGVLLLARLGDEPVGCVGLCALADAIGEMKRLYVRPELTPAIALYERYGFRPIAPYRKSQCLAALYFERAV
jgi:hypothetical protein